MLTVTRREFCGSAFKGAIAAAAVPLATKAAAAVRA